MDMKARVVLLEDRLRNLMDNVMRDIPSTEGSAYLWAAVEDAEQALNHWYGKDFEVEEFHEGL